MTDIGGDDNDDDDDYAAAAAGLATAASLHTCNLRWVC